MKKYLFFIAFGLGCCGDAAAQLLPALQPEQDACNALPLCGGIFTTPYSYRGYGRKIEQIQFEPNLGCFDESNSVWLKLTVAKAGTIAFTITPFNTKNDYDFAVYNITGSDCNDINGFTRVRCNGADNYSTLNGVTGMSAGYRGTETGPGMGSDFIAAINAGAGDVYLILIDNFFYGPMVSGFSIDFSPSTAVFTHPAAPHFTKAPQASNGATDQVNLRLSNKIKCSSIAANGSDFSVSAEAGAAIAGSIVSASGRNCTADGYSSDISIHFSRPLDAGRYVLHAKKGSDGNTLLDFCNSSIAMADSVGFVLRNTDTVEAVAPAKTRIEKDTISYTSKQVEQIETVDTFASFKVIIPESFSPNGDGKDDIFKPEDIRFLKMVEFRVLNKKGEELFSTTNKTGGWDGNCQGQKQEYGDYQYIIRLAWPDGRIETHKGNVELIR